MRKIMKEIITDTVKCHLNPNFHVSFGTDGIEVLTPNKTLGVKINPTTDVLNKLENLDVIGRMLNQSFTNKAWEIL